jgi:hypothetical protein
MRMLLKLRFPMEPGNARLKDGSFGRLMQATMDRVKPEAAYFYADRGCRAGLLVFDLKDSSEIPSICEPLFDGLNAEIEIQPCMNAEDLGKGLNAAGL